MSEVTKDDLNRVHDRIDETNKTVMQTNESVNKMAVAMERLAVTLEKLNIPTQPCSFLEDHLQDHKNERTWWKHTVLGNIIRHVITAVTASAVAIWAAVKFFAEKVGS